MMNLNKDMTTLEISEWVKENYLAETLPDAYPAILTQTFSEKLLDVLQPMNTLTLPFILAALKIVTKHISDLDEFASMLSNVIVRTLNQDVIAIQVPKARRKDQ